MGRTGRVALCILALLLVITGCGGAADRPAPDPRAPAPDPVLAPALRGGEPRAADDPSGIARQLTVAERTVRDPRSAPERVRAAGWTAQVAYRALEYHPEWDAGVLAAVPPGLHDAVVRNTAARREFQAMQGRLPDQLPAWRIVEPLPVPQLRALYDEAQARFGVPWQVLAAVHLVETGSGRIVGLSSAGAQGPMQFIPETWARYGMGGNVGNPRDAILGAANYLAANGAAGSGADLDRALHRYNNDVRYVSAVRHYASLMTADERAFLGFHAWQVYYRTPAGDVRLPAGYESARQIPVEQWLARRPG